MTDAVEATLTTARTALLEMRNPDGWWTGRLSGSALSTATAVTALTAVDPEEYEQLIADGLKWLTGHANTDGGWGDTPKSQSNLPTTLLVWSAFGAAGSSDDRTDAAANAEKWLTERIGNLRPGRIAAAVTDIYGADRTFAVPILTMCALSGRLGPPDEAWKLVGPLPFELAALPHRCFKWLGLPVVSYALPALIAIGQAGHYHRPTRNPLTRLLRNATRARTLRKLRSIQPVGGGFLEAAPLTSFVAMSLASAGNSGHAVTNNCIAFLRETVRSDGSWPIDTDLATWVSTLSVNALAAGGRLDGVLSPEDRAAVAGWLCDRQYTDIHPYTHAAPGGWAWTPLSGGVPDADDTAGAMIALHNLTPDSGRAQQAAAAGAKWLIGLQNRDGGIPTFCRGWGKLPFDRSCPDLTAHAITAWRVWRDAFEADLAGRVERASSRAVEYLVRSQRDDGSWLPLWFGNENAADRANPTYGTARVLLGLAQGGVGDEAVGAIARAANRLISTANQDGGWGGDAGVTPSIEETALAVDALASLRLSPAGPDPALAERLGRAAEDGVAWLVEHTDGGRVFAAAPIGLYFAKLWYYEELYPAIFTVSALNRFLANRASIPENHGHTIDI